MTQSLHQITHGGCTVRNLKSQWLTEVMANGYVHASRLASAALCVMLALTALGRMTPAGVRRLCVAAMNRSAGTVGSWIERDYLVSMDTQDLCALAHLLDMQTRCAITHSTRNRAVRWTVAQLKEDRPVIVGIDTLERFDLWMVSIGYVPKAPACSDQLLLVDPERPLPPTLQWNAIFDSGRNGVPACVSYGDGEAHPATLKGAVSLAPIEGGRHG
jgi:hypothetical protein